MRRDLVHVSLSHWFVELTFFVIRYMDNLSTLTSNEEEKKSSTSTDGDVRSTSIPTASHRKQIYKVLRQHVFGYEPKMSALLLTLITDIPPLLLPPDMRHACAPRPNVHRNAEVPIAVLSSRQVRCVWVRFSSIRAALPKSSFTLSINQKCRVFATSGEYIVQLSNGIRVHGVDIGWNGNGGGPMDGQGGWSRT